MNWFWNWTWNQYSESKLLSVEQKILSILKTKYNTEFVKIERNKDEYDKIWTISLNTNSPRTPLVLIHGFAAGIGFWVRNLDYLSKVRPVYAMDLLGFGRSSRPEFSTNSLEAEQQLVDSIEAWRKEMNLDRFILLGHSMGGFLATSYAIRYPERVKHLILADPWGFVDKKTAIPKIVPLKWKILTVLLYPFTTINPLASVRALGPLGPWFIQRLRGDIINKFDDVFEDHSIIPNYIYHCNAQDPTGEAAFHNMIEGFGWAKNPMINRVSNLNKKIPITYIYGQETWMDKEVPFQLEEIRHDCPVDIVVMEESGHHIYADQPDEFNALVENACENCDGEKNGLDNKLTSKNGGHNLEENDVKKEAVLQEAKCNFDS